MGFQTVWYTPALRSAVTVLVDDLELRAVTAPYFIGTKLEAFRGRGEGDFYASSDSEDIITVVDGGSLDISTTTSPPEARFRMKDLLFINPLVDRCYMRE